MTATLAASLTTKVPLPSANPVDIWRTGCAIEEHHDEGADRWPLTVWVDVRGVKPSSDCEITPKHSWCSQYSIQDSRAKALKDCDNWLKQLKKAFKRSK